MTDEFAEKLQAPLAMQPNIITNDRLKRPNFPGDYKTPEQRIPKLDELDGKDWETCMTMNETWGYKSWANDWKSTETLVRNLIDIASKGGNYLLNVGPKANGEIPVESISSLKEIGQWMKKNSESIYGSQKSPLEVLPWGRCTSKRENGKNILYLFVFDWPSDGKLKVPGVKGKTESASLLASGKKLTVKEGTTLEISLPMAAPDKIATVIKVVLN
jgi:alpha-L-fucosidase